jgi:hypothetical protein
MNGDHPAPLLSDIVETGATTRRHFLGKSALGLVIGGAAVAACQQDGARSGQRPDSARGVALTNPNSRLDTALHGDVRRCRASSTSAKRTRAACVPSITT